MTSTLPSIGCGFSAAGFGGGGMPGALAGVKRVVLGLRHADLKRTDLGRYTMESFADLVGGGVELQTGVRVAECLAIRKRWGKDAVAK